MEEMYKVFNMGHRMETICSENIARDIISISEGFGIEARIVGKVEKSHQAEVGNNFQNTENSTIEDNYEKSTVHQDRHLASLLSCKKMFHRLSICPYRQGFHDSKHSVFYGDFEEYPEDPAMSCPRRSLDSGTGGLTFSKDRISGCF